LLNKNLKLNLNPIEYKYFLVIQTLYNQQRKLFDEQSHSVDDRIVSIHQSHVRPIVRAKANANVEFGVKIQISMMKGYAFLDVLSEGTSILSVTQRTIKVTLISLIFKRTIIS